jgi:phosphorylase kinase alpha/beta subunit
MKMTKEELKFALLVENSLNQVSEPEYRQLVVEACMIMTLLSESEPKFYLNEIICIDDIIKRANEIFIDEQSEKQNDGQTLFCCSSSSTLSSSTSKNNKDEKSSLREEKNKRCNGAKRICEYFYDLAPSGRFGTMNYLFKSFTESLKIIEKNDCIIN